MTQKQENFDFPNAAIGLNPTDLFIKFVNKFVKFKKIKQIYQQHSDKKGLELIDSFLRELNLEVVFDEKELKKIPEEGSFITVSNFPLGGLEGLLLLKMILPLRSDYKLLVNPYIHSVSFLKEFTIPFGETGKNSVGLKNIKKALDYLNQGGALGIFPATKVAAFNPTRSEIIDRKWNEKLVKLIKIAKVPVIPIFIQDTNRTLFHVLGMFHPIFQSFMLQNEILKKKDAQINVRIGKVITPDEIEKIPDLTQLSVFLRVNIYSLNKKIEINRGLFFKPKKIVEPEPIAEPTDQIKLESQIRRANDEGYLLFSNQSFELYCAPSYIFPDVVREIGRLREITFREIGEGTNKSLDLDQFDLYYHHLVIWDAENKKIVGSYRFGRGDEIMERFGIKGFYLHTLFKFKRPIYPYFNQTLELGRSFIVKEYQRKPLSLFMLWKGILYYLLKNPNYRYLMGPVSISGNFSELSKALIKRFFEKYYFNEELAQYVKPRKKFKTKFTEQELDVLLENIGNDINKLDRYIKEVEKGLRIPVLYKKYMSLNAKTLAFNVDPDFNYCLDGLMILDLMDVPLETVKALAKELNDEKLIEHFGGK